MLTRQSTSLKKTGTSKHKQLKAQLKMASHSLSTIILVSICSEIDLKKMFFTPLMSSRACVPTSDELHAKAFSLAASLQWGISL